MEAVATPSSEWVIAALSGAAESARVALDRLFAPLPVRLVETTVGPVDAMSVPDDLQVDFEVGGPLHARVVIAAGGFASGQLADALLARGATAGLDAPARE